MTINNYNSNVPSTVKQYFYSQIPYGSEYYIYTSNSNNYVMLLRKVGSDTFTQYTVTRNTSSSHYTYSVSDYGSIDSVTVSDPVYCYSSESLCGIKEVLPNAQWLDSLMLIVTCSCIVLAVVFGGIRHWKRLPRRY